MDVRSYFQKKAATTPSCNRTECAGGSFYAHHHVQQKSEEEERLWNLNPRFVLSSSESSAESCNFVKSSQWICTNTVLEPSQDEGKNCPTPNSIHSVWDQLQKQQSPSFNVMQKFERYRLLTSKEILTSADSLMCSIPVVVTPDKVMVDDKALPRKDRATNNLPWTHVYSPTHAKHMIGNPNAISALLQWLQSWSKGKTKKVVIDEDDDPDFLPAKKNLQPTEHCEDTSAILLHGPHGSGKTISVYACAAQLGYKVFEVNASMVRSKSQLLQKLREATLSHRVQPFSMSKFSDKSVRVGCNTVILFDEIDVIFPCDHGFLHALQDIISSTKCPVVLTCSDPPVADLDVIKLQFHLPSELELAMHSSLLSLANGWPLALEHSLQLCRYFSSDIRKVILHLQLMLAGSPTDPVPSDCRDDDGSSQDRGSLGSSSTCFLSVDSYRHMHCPWRSTNGINHGLANFTNPSHLDITSMLYDQISEVDTIQENQKEKVYTYRPWTSRLEPSLLDELPDNFTPFCLLHKAIGQTLYKLLYADHPAPAHALASARSLVDNPIETVLDELFSKSWVLNQTSMVTECLPLMKVMCYSSNGLTSGRLPRIRQLSDILYLFILVKLMGSLFYTDLGITSIPTT